MYSIEATSSCSNPTECCCSIVYGRSVVHNIAIRAKWHAHTGGNAHAVWGALRYWFGSVRTYNKDRCEGGYEACECHVWSGSDRVRMHKDFSISKWVNSRLGPPLVPGIRLRQTGMHDMRRCELIECALANQPAPYRLCARAHKSTLQTYLKSILIYSMC